MLFRGTKRSHAVSEVRSVSTAFELLEALAGSDEPLGVTEIARAVGITKTRGYRHLRTLVASGYVTQDPRTEKYQAGVKLFLLGQKVAGQHSFLSAARKVMRPLRDALGHTVTLSGIEKGAVVVLDMVRGSSAFEIGTKPGARFPLDRSAQGKIALAFRSDGDLPQLSKEQVKLRREVRLVRNRGWAVAPEEILRGVNALAAPIFFADGTLAGTIALVDSIEVLPPDPSKKQISAIQEAARRVSAELGYS
ncbi:MAG: IclR family transcriptional regulator [Vicinamibacteria bacterium]